SEAVEGGQFGLSTGEVWDVGGKLAGSLKRTIGGVGLAVHSILPVEVDLRLLVEGYERPRCNVQLDLVGLHNVEGSQPVAPLVFDQRAVDAVEPSCQRPERDALLFSCAPA